MADSTPSPPDRPMRDRPRRFPPPSTRPMGIDAVIQDAIARGAFDDLPGAGKPLEPEHGEYAGEWALAFHVLKQAGERPLWISLGSEIEADQAALRRLLERAAERSAVPRQSPSGDDRPRRAAERRLLRAQYLELAAALDEKLSRYSLLVPVSRLEKGRLPPHVAASRFDAVWPE